MTTTPSMRPSASEETTPANASSEAAGVRVDSAEMMSAAATTMHADRFALLVMPGSPVLHCRADMLHTIKTPLELHAHADLQHPRRRGGRAKEPRWPIRLVVRQ